MTPITTKSTRERLIRNLLVMFMLLGYAGWSFYDGFIGYPQGNLAHARKQIPAEAQAGAEINGRVVYQTLQRMRGEGVLKKGRRLSEIEAGLGKPSWQGPSANERNSAYWFGPGGTLIVRYGTGGVLTNEAQFKPGPHTEKDLFIQKLMGACIGVLGLYTLLRVLMILLTRVTLSDAGLKIPSGRLIPFEAMSGWDTSDHKDKGRIALTYDAGGRAKVFVLDDYKLAAFRPIVDEICTRKGFESPFEVAESQQSDSSHADVS